MNPSQIIQNLQSRLIRTHAISVECKVDNFANRRQCKVRYNIYIDQQDDMPISAHISAYNLEDAVSKANAHIDAHFIPVPTLPPISLIDNPFPTFLSCSSPEQDEEPQVEVESLAIDNEND